MTDSTVAACRAALLKTCYWQQDAPSEGGPSPEESTKPRTVFVDVDDAAACMARAIEKQNDLLDWAWTIIANAGGGDWSKESAEWQEAAAKWRDSYYKSTACANGRESSHE